MLNVQLLHDYEQVGVQYSMTVNELAELLALIGCGPLASRPSINRRVLGVGGFHTVWGGIDPLD